MENLKPKFSAHSNNWTLTPMTKVSKYFASTKSAEMENRRGQTDKDEKLKILLQSCPAWRERAHRIKTPVRHAVMQLDTNYSQGDSRQARQVPNFCALKERVREDEVAKLSEMLANSLGKQENLLDNSLIRLHTTTPVSQYFRTRVNTSKTQSSTDQFVNHQDFEEANNSKNMFLKPRQGTFPSRNVSSLRHKTFALNWSNGHSRDSVENEFHYQKGVHHTDMHSKRMLANQRQINGPIQLLLYMSNKNDKLRPLIARDYFWKPLREKSDVENLIHVRPISLQCHKKSTDADETRMNSEAEFGRISALAARVARSALEKSVVSN